VPEVHSLEGESSPRFLECDKVVHFSLVREVPKVNGLREKIVLNATPKSSKMWHDAAFAVLGTVY
jgi:hypothetical protein